MWNFQKTKYGVTAILIMAPSVFSPAVKAKDSETFYTYETAFKPPLEMVSVLRQFMKSSKGFAEACKAAWEETNFGFNVSCEAKDRSIKGVLFSNGYFRLMSTYPGQTQTVANARATAKNPSARQFALKALDVASTTRVFPQDHIKLCKSTIGKMPDSSEFSGRECEDLTFQISWTRSSQNDGAIVNINRRLAFARKPDGSIIKGDLFGAGLKVTIWDTDAISVIEGRPLDVDLQSRRVIPSLKAVSQTLADFAEWTSTPGFDPLGFLQMPARPGYSALPIGMINDRSVELAVNHLPSSTRRVDEIPFPDPAMPAPLLRPSWLFSPAHPLYPAEPISLPADNLPNLKRVQISSAGNAREKTSLSAELTLSPLKTHIVWKKYSLKTGQSKQVGIGKDFEVKSPTDTIDFYIAGVMVPEISHRAVISVPVWIAPKPNLKQTGDSADVLLEQLVAQTSAANCRAKNESRGALLEDNLLKLYPSDLDTHIPAGERLAQASIPLPGPLRNFPILASEQGLLPIGNWSNSSFFTIAVRDGRFAEITKLGDMHKGLGAPLGGGEGVNKARFGTVDVGPFQAGIVVRAFDQGNRLNDLIKFQSAPCNWGQTCGNLRAIPPQVALQNIVTGSPGDPVAPSGNWSVSGDWLVTDRVGGKRFYKQYQMGLNSSIGTVHVSTLFTVRNDIDGGPGVPGQDWVQWVPLFQWNEQRNRWLSLGKNRPGIEVNTVIKVAVDECLLTEKSLTEFCAGASSGGGMRFAPLSADSWEESAGVATALCQTYPQNFATAKSIRAEAQDQGPIIKNVSSLRMTVAGNSSVSGFLTEGGRGPYGVAPGIAEWNGELPEAGQLTPVLYNTTFLGLAGRAASNAGWTFKPLEYPMTMTPTTTNGFSGAGTTHNAHLKAYPAPGTWDPDMNSTPGNIAIPGCASMEPYNKGSGQYVWDDTPNCMHTHSQWIFASYTIFGSPLISGPLYMGDAAYTDAGQRIWSIDKETGQDRTNFESPLFNPAKLNRDPNTKLCEPSGKDFTFKRTPLPGELNPDAPNPSTQMDDNEPFYSCAKSAFFEVQARNPAEANNMAGVGWRFHGIPIFFTE